MSSSSSPVNVKSGTVDISFSEKDNLISSTSKEESAFFVDEDATLIINSEGGKSLKIDSEEDVPAISGTGTIVLEDSNGHLKLNEANNLNNSTPEISVGTYQYKGTNPKYNAVLNNGEFSFELIGYVDSSGILFPNQMSSDNKLDFSARGIVKVYTKSVKTVSEEVVNGNYVIKYRTTQQDYTLIPPTLELLDGTQLLKGTDYQYDEDTKTLTIYGTAFAKENIRIFAHTEGEISYIAQSVEKTYTGEAFHIGIQLQESKFDIYYREGVAFSANPTEDELKAEGVFKNQHITKTDVCDTTIYFYIKAKPEYDDENYQPVRGSEKLIITKGVNEFIGAQLACKDVVLNSSPNPVIKSKWGTPEYLYYSDPEGNTPVDVSEIGTVTATYYVKAFVKETQNYDRIETDYLIRFEVFKTEVFTSTEKSFTPVSGTDTTLSMPANTAFSIYYDTTYNGGMKIEFSVPLSAGTKITLIDFSEEKAMYYVYFTKDTDVTDGKTQILMDSFYLMGDESTKLNPSNGDRISYQFCVEANQTDFVYMEVKFGEMTTITIEPLASRKTQFSEEPNKENNAIGTARIPISIDSRSAAFGGNTNVVTVRMSDFPDGAFIYLATNDGIIISPSLSNGIFVFDIGADKTENEYYLVIENLDDSKEYEIDLDVRICDMGSIMYPLADKSSTNHYEITLQYNRSSNVYIVMSDRVIEKGTMKIMFTPVIRSDIGEIYGGIYKKALTGGYELYAEVTPNNINIIRDESTGGYAIEVILVDTPLTEGTYKIKATVNGKECEYMFIVQ